jgi:hypothetical protein
MDRLKLALRFKPGGCDDMPLIAHEILSSSPPGVPLASRCQIPESRTHLYHQTWQRNVFLHPALLSWRTCYRAALPTYGITRRRTGVIAQKIEARFAVTKRRSEHKPEGRPGSVDFGLVAAKEISNHRGDAGDMNMQLALAAAGHRIYGHSDLVSQQLTAHPLLNKAAGVPSCLPIVWGVFALQRRTFNTGNADGWNDDDMRGARRCLELIDDLGTKARQ